MMIDRCGEDWRITILGGNQASPRIEIFHPERDQSMKIARYCEEALERGFPEDFIPKPRVRDHVTNALLTLVSLTFFGAQIAFWVRMFS